MHPLPFQTITIPIDGKPEETFSLLRQSVEPGTLFSIFTATKPFIGTVSTTTFRIHRALDYANAFQPVLFGRLRSAGDRPQLLVTFRLGTGILRFSTLFFLPTIVIGISESTTHGIRFIEQPSIWFSLIMPALITLIALAGYWVEFPKSKRMLLDVLQNRPDNNAMNRSRGQRRLK